MKDRRVVLEFWVHNSSVSADVLAVEAGISQTIMSLMLSGAMRVDDNAVVRLAPILARHNKFNETLIKNSFEV